MCRISVGLILGRAVANVLGGTTWSGWNIEENLLGINKISVSEAHQMSNEDFKTVCPVLVRSA